MTTRNWSQKRHVILSYSGLFLQLRSFLSDLSSPRAFVYTGQFTMTDVQTEVPIDTQEESLDEGTWETTTVRYGVCGAVITRSVFLPPKSLQ